MPNYKAKGQSSASELTDSIRNIEVAGARLVGARFAGNDNYLEFVPGPVPGKPTLLLASEDPPPDMELSWSGDLLVRSVPQPVRVWRLAKAGAEGRALHDVFVEQTEHLGGVSRDAPATVGGALGVGSWSYPGRVIRSGESDHSLVKAIRARLRDIHIDVAATGPFDEALTVAIKLFQVRSVDAGGRTLVADGKVGPITWAALFSEQPPRVTSSYSRLLRHALSIARTQLHVREIPVNSNRGSDVERYLRSVDLGGGYPWCAAFVYWCLAEAAKETEEANRCKRSGGVHAQWQHARTQRIRTVTAKAARNDPAQITPGMVFVIDSGGGLGHCGFVTSVHGAWFRTIEGNTDASRTREGGGVYELTRKVGEVNLGYVEY